MSAGNAPDAQQQLLLLQRAAEAADQAWEHGDHRGVVDALRPVMDDPGTWEWFVGTFPAELVTDLAYRGGISLLACGEPTASGAWLGRVLDLGADDGRVRRALAQVETASGNLDRADDLLASDAAPMARALATTVAGYRRDHDQVMQRARDTREALAAAGDDQHPWDMAGAYVQVGFALVEVCEGPAANITARMADLLLEGAPSQVPLVAQTRILTAAAQRLEGDLAAAHAELDRAWPLLHAGTCDLGMAERERARCLRAAGSGDDHAAYARAVVTFAAAGEEFLATATQREATEPRGT